MIEKQQDVVPRERELTDTHLADSASIDPHLLAGDPPVAIATRRSDHQPRPHAAAAVHAQWSADRLRTEIRRALTEAATNTVLAMPHQDTETSAVMTHLERAWTALLAATELAADDEQPVLSRLAR